MSRLSSVAEQDADEKVRNAAGDAAEKYRSKLNFFDCLAPLSNNSDLSDNESKDGVLIGEVTTIVFAGHIFRTVPNSDHGIDGEIEFKNERGEAIGKRVYLQL